MKCYVDTSAMYALIDGADSNHERAASWLESATDGFDPAWFVTSSHALVETIALIQRRLGMDAVSRLLRDAVPRFLVVQLSDFAFSQCLTALAADGRRRVSLVDHIGFHAARTERCDAVFAFDEHFGEAGFRVVPGSD